ncbi:hypothetical protein A3863_18685 [Priestia endophytica]|uniref:Uncharacterized protein n=1 Tax=Priestia endophytica TaxID=135735 RepID=A0AAX1Q8K8_9BACI|nr:hypothetical protein A3864_11760 [Priestia endophytica]RAS85844.1 hypothetical protein A3863_18685 [Priestia endophytica]
MIVPLVCCKIGFVIAFLLKAKDEESTFFILFSLSFILFIHKSTVSLGYGERILSNLFQTGGSFFLTPPNKFLIVTNRLQLKQVRHIMPHLF